MAFALVVALESFVIRCFAPPMHSSWRPAARQQRHPANVLVYTNHAKRPSLSLPQTLRIQGYGLGCSALEGHLAGKRLEIIAAAAAADHVRYARHTVRQIIVAAGRMVD